MAINVRLSPDEEAVLERLARQAGRSKNDVIRMALLEKAAGSRPAPGSADVRGYARHWTPVHLDFHVTDLEARLARIEAAGGFVEQVHAHSKHGSVAFCSDPFGHGFCVLERPANEPAAS